MILRQRQLPTAFGVASCSFDITMISFFVESLLIIPSGSIRPAIGAVPGEGPHKGNIGPSGTERHDIALIAYTVFGDIAP